MLSCVDTLLSADGASLPFRFLVMLFSSVESESDGLDCIDRNGLAVLALPNGFGTVTTTSVVGLTPSTLGERLPLRTPSPKSNPVKFPANPSAMAGLVAFPVLSFSSPSTSIVKLCRRGV